MSNRHRYSINGVHIFKHFAVQVAQNDFDPVSVGRIGGDEWFLQLEKWTNGDVMYPIFFCHNDDPNVKHKVRSFFNILNHHDSTTRNFEDESYEDSDNNHTAGGPLVLIREILDPKNGWLDEDGAIHLEYGIQVEAICKNQIWTFNFSEPFFDYRSKDNVVQIEHNGTHLLWHFHKQLYRFHASKTWRTQSFDFRIGRMNEFLQLAHGVRLPTKDFHVLDTIEHAYYMKMHNVVRICEQQLIEMWCLLGYLDLPFEKTMEKIKTVIQLNLHHCLARLLSTRHCSNRIEFSKWILKNLNVEMLSSEVMKMLAKKVFEF